MPSGKVHDSIAFFSIFPILSIGYFVFKLSLIEITILILAALFTQLMFGPDLDSKSLHYKRWGLFKWLWLPYRKIIPHRSKFSHGLFWGTLTRTFYLFSMLLLLFILLNYLFIQYLSINLAFILFKIPEIISIKLLILYFIWILLGFFVGTTIHTLTDKIVSFFKNLI